jgi:putative heme-binding domain-containing protein
MRPIAPSACRTLFAAGLLLLFQGGTVLADDPEPESLEEQLRDEDPDDLLEDARLEGDARRGALLFHQSLLACSKCHVPAGDAPPLGPELGRPEPNTTERRLLEALLWPSRTIRRGYETITVELDDGRVASGIVAAETDDTLSLRTISPPGETVAIDKAQIADREVNPQSGMPSGQVNLLGGRPQFLDLLRYVLEVAESGPRRAAQLAPPPALVAEDPVPEYEQRVDHAALIAAWDEASLRRGEAI